MPKQVTGVEITDNGDDTVNIQIGLFGYTRQKAELFDRTSDHGLIKGNLRLSFQIGGYAEPASLEFVEGINRDGQGMEGRDGKVKILSVVLEDVETETYRVTFTDRKGQTFGIPISKSELKSEWNDPEVVIGNFGPFLRLRGFNQLTPAAINAIRAAKFWY